MGWCIQNILVLTKWAGAARIHWYRQWAHPRSANSFYKIDARIWPNLYNEISIQPTISISTNRTSLLLIVINDKNGLGSLPDSTGDGVWRGKIPVPEDGQPDSPPGLVGIGVHLNGWPCWVGGRYFFTIDTHIKTPTNFITINCPSAQ